MSLPPFGDVKNDFHLGLEFGFRDGGPSDGVRYMIIVYADYATLCYLIFKKDLHFIYLT